MLIHGVVKTHRLKSNDRIVYLLGETHSPTDTSPRTLVDWLDSSTEHRTIIAELSACPPIETRWGKLYRCDVRGAGACRHPLFSTQPSKFLTYPQTIASHQTDPLTADRLVSLTFKHILETLHGLDIMGRLDLLVPHQRQAIVRWIQAESEAATNRYFLLVADQKISNLYHQMLALKSLPMDVWIVIEILLAATTTIVVAGHHHLPGYISILSSLGYITLE